jgi:hypothetical protein
MNTDILSNDEALHARRDEQPASSTALEVLVASLGIRLGPEELEWLASALTERAEHKRRQAKLERYRSPTLAGQGKVKGRDPVEPRPEGGNEGASGE